MNAPTASFVPKKIRRLMAAALPLACLAAFPAGASPMFGALSNFDVVNDTGSDTNGFEIELEGIKSTDIAYTFEWETYGKPRITDAINASGTPVVRVRYESPYDPATGTFHLRTVNLANPGSVITNGHQCVNTPLINNTNGCEHFGLGTIGNPTKVTYHWLASVPNQPGVLGYATTTNPNTGEVQQAVVNIPAPIWNVQPPADPVVNPNPVVQAVIPKEAPEVEQEHQQACSKWGPVAQWMVSYVTETEHAELDNLVADCGDLQACEPKAPHDKSETEVEWQLQQTRPTCDENGDPIVGAEEENEIKNEAQAQDPNHKSIVRRYEFYEYAGAYDDLDGGNHEAQPIGGCKDSPFPCDASGNIDLTQPPNEDLGDYMGAQNAAVNVEDADSDKVSNVDPTGDHSKDDNCALKPNENQRNTNPNVDGYGNACDPDLDNDGLVENDDLNLMKAQFMKKVPSPDADLNGDGKVNFADVAILRNFLGKPPGPKGSELAP